MKKKKKKKKMLQKINWDWYRGLSEEEKIKEKNKEKTNMKTCLKKQAKDIRIHERTH